MPLPAGNAIRDRKIRSVLWLSYNGSVRGADLIRRFACSFVATAAVGVSPSARSKLTLPSNRPGAKAVIITTSAAPDAGRSTRCLWRNWKSPFLDRRPQRSSSTRFSHQLSAISYQLSAIPSRSAVSRQPLAYTRSLKYLLKRRGGVLHTFLGPAAVRALGRRAVIQMRTDDQRLLLAVSSCPTDDG